MHAKGCCFHIIIHEGLNSDIHKVIHHLHLERNAMSVKQMAAENSAALLCIHDIGRFSPFRKATSIMQLKRKTQIHCTDDLWERSPSWTKYHE